MNRPSAGLRDSGPPRVPREPKQAFDKSGRLSAKALLAFVMIRLVAALLAGWVVAGSNGLLVAAAIVGTAFIVGLPAVLVVLFVWLLVDFFCGSHDR